MKKSHILTIVGTVASLGLVYHLASPVEQATASVTLKPNEQVVVALGEQVYAQNCASCHGAKLEGQANWRQRNDASTGTCRRRPTTKPGHTWHHSDAYLFQITKYGLEELIGEKYPNNMPAYKETLSDEEIIAFFVLYKKHVVQKHTKQT